MWFYYYKFWKVSLTTTIRTYLAGNKNKSDTFTLYHTCRLYPINYDIHSIHHKKNLPYTTAPNLSKLCGKIISTKFVLGNILQLKARNLHEIIKAELTWNRRIRLHENDKANQKISFWRINLIRLNSYQVFAFCILTKSLLFLFLQAQVMTPYPHNFLKEDKYPLYFSVSTK